MTDIFKAIEKKKQDDIDKAVKERANKIIELRDLTLEALKTSGISAGDAHLVLKSCAEKLSMAWLDKPLTDFV